MADKDLKYYLDHPDEMPEDPKILEQLANDQIRSALEGGTEQVTVERFAKIDEIPDSSSEAKTEVKDAPAAEAKEEAPKADAKQEAKPEGVLAKDGKNVIPYAVLEAARRREQDAMELARTQAEEIARLKADGVAKAAKDVQDAAALTEEELKVLEQDQPTLAKLLRAQQAEISGLKTTLSGVTERVQEQVEQTEGDIKAEIQTAIDANPKMAAWQVAQDQTLWNEAAKFDRILRENPLYADIPFAKRFEKVVEMTENAMGLQPERPAPRTPDPAAVRAAAEKKLKNISTAPRSLTDIPGGAPPAQDERESVEGMNIAALGEKFMHMTPDQLNEYLATL